MGKFKVGDRVRRVRDCPWPEDYGSVGVEYTVLRVEGRYGIVVIPNSGSASADDFELVQPTAIRTVTRREIVPGVYGEVTVGETHAGRVEVSLSRNPDLYYEATELREAAHLLNQIAEVLEENAALEMKEAA